MLFRYEYFWYFKTQITFIFEDNIFLHLSGPIGQIYAHNKMSDVFNLGLITPVAYYI